MKEEKISFEDALKELEEISEKIEMGDISLQKSVEYFERGIYLSNICANELKSAKQKIISLEEAENEELNNG